MTRRILLGVVVLSLLRPMAWAQPVLEAHADFHVFPGIHFQTMTGFGAGVCESTLKDMQPLKPADRQRLYDLVYGDDGLRLNIIRLHVSPHAQPLAAGAALRERGLRYDWERDAHTQNVYQAIAPALKRGPRLLYAVPFTPPLRWKSNKQLTGGGRLLRDNYRDYAEYLADFVDYYQRGLGLRIDVLSLQNEPDVAVWWDSCRWTGDELRDFLKLLAPAFQRRGLATKFMLSEGSTWDQAWIRVAPALDDPQSRPLVGILASHSYGGDDLVDAGRNLFCAASARHNIPIWMSEMSIIGPPDDPSMNAALKIAHVMYRDIVHGNAAAWIYCFVIFKPEYHGSMGVLSPAAASGLTIPKRFWALANTSRFVQPGWKRIRIDGLAFANSAFVSPAGDRLAIVAINASGAARPATYHFGDWALSSIKTYVTSKDHDLALVASPSIENGALHATLAPRSVTTLVAELRRAPAQPHP